MTEIRKEYKNFKLLNEQAIEQKAKTWVMHNVILLNERFDRSTLHRLNSSIQRFEQKFGPYRTKLPAVARVLSDAEKGLNVVITGGASKKSAGHMLERMTLIYNILSNFFGHDLQMLLKTPVFRTAIAMPERALNQIEHPDHNQKMIKKVLIAAIKPDKVEREVFDRIYKNIPMPSINWNETANQLMGLCVNDLQDLCGIERVPAIVVNEKPSDEETTAEVEALTEQIRSIEERPEFRLLQTAINGISTFANENNFSQGFKDKVREISDQLVNLINDQSLSTRIGNFFASAGGLISMNDPVARLLGQATRVVQTFTTVRQVWNSNKELFVSRSRNARRVNPGDETAIKNLFTRALERGGQVAAGLGRLNIARIPDAPGLEPSVVSEEFWNHVVKPELDRAATGAAPSGATFQITFNTNGATDGDRPRPISLTREQFTRGETVNLPDKGNLKKVQTLSGGTRIDLTFRGWSDQRDATDGEDSYTLSGTPRAITLYAVWTGGSR